MIKPDEKAALLKRYSDRLAQHGPTVEALGWNKPKHRLRYRVLLEYWLTSAPSGSLRVLDFGCGFGDLFGYAQERGMSMDYTGLDINPDLIRIAQERYPAGRFLCMDPFERPFDEKYDIVLSSGVHNYRLSDSQGFIEHSFELFDRHSILGFAANFLSSRVNFQNEHNHYSAPEEILALALRHTSRVALRHDYMPFEFTVFADKRNEMDENLTVFLPFVEDCSEYCPPRPQR
jgi:SAM-dependent methyltransferase